MEHEKYFLSFPYFLIQENYERREIYLSYCASLLQNLQKTEKIYIVLSKEASRKKFVGSFTFLNLVSSIKLGSNWIYLMSYC